MMNILKSSTSLFLRSGRSSLTCTYSMSTSTDPKLRFHGQTAVVTASTDGIGFGIARRLAQDGAYVIISSRKQANVDKALSTLHGEGLKNVSGIVCDAISKKDRESLLKFTLQQRPGVDILVSCHGKALLKPLLQVDESHWEYISNMNWKSHFFLTQEMVPYIIKRGKGSIIYLSSASGFIPINTRGIYPITKAAINHMTAIMAMELADYNIRVNCIAPGLIDTPLAQSVISNEESINRLYQRALIKRVGKPEEIASVVSFLASEDASFITGEVLVVSGGYHCRT